MRILFLSSWTYLRRRPLQLMFSILGISLGVAIAVAMDLAIYSAKQSFQLSVKSLSGSATHSIVADNQVVPENIYQRLRVELGLNKLTPLIKSYVALPDYSQQMVRLIGMDPFANGGLQGISQDSFETINGEIIQRLLVQPNAIIVADVFLQERGLKVADHIMANINGKNVQLKIIASYQLKSVLKDELKNWLIGDISTVQELTQMYGYVSQIDLVLSAHDKELLERIRHILPFGVRIIETDQNNKALARLSESFELNLSALSLLGLLVAMFLIYNTTIFSVVQRRNMFARMRVMGVTRGELFQVILWEAFLIACIATGIGILLGVGLAKVLLSLVSQTINDLYYRIQVEQLYWGQVSLIKAVLLGLGTTLLAASFPALEAALTKPIKVLQRFDLEKKIKRWLNLLLIPGILGCIGVSFLIADRDGDIVMGFIAVFLLIISIALLLPWLIQRILVILGIGMKRLFALPGKMAVNNISRSLSRSVVAIIALSIAVSATLGIAIMIKSFRLTVDEWLAGYLRADYFITSLDQQVKGALISPELKKKIAQISAVQALSHDHRRQFFINGAYHQLIVLDIPEDSFKAFRLKEGDPKQVQTEWFEQDTLLVSEPYAYRHGIELGDSIYLPVEKCPDENPELNLASDQIKQQPFKVVGVFYHYGSEQGLINMSRSTYTKYWQDAQINSIGVYLYPNTEHKQFEAELNKLIAGDNLHLLSKAKIHQESLRIFDRTFSVTQVLKLLVLIVSFVGILSALMAIALERNREFAILRVLGLTPGQLSRLVYLETLTMGMVAALLALPMGTILAYLLVEVINYRSFGWSMLFVLPLQEYVYAFLLALFAALSAAIYPAWYMAKTQPALSLRGE